MCVVVNTAERKATMHAASFQLSKHVQCCASAPEAPVEGLLNSKADKGQRLSVAYVELGDLLVLDSLLVNLAGSSKVQGLMHGQVGDVLIILVHQTSSSLNDKVFLVFAIVLDVTSHSAEGCVLEVASQQLKKNGLAGAWWSHEKSGAALYAQNSEKDLDENKRSVKLCLLFIALRIL